MSVDSNFLVLFLRVPGNKTNKFKIIVKKEQVWVSVVAQIGIVIALV